MSKNATYVSCWTRCLEAKECSAKTYGNAALMVFTTVGKLKKVMPKTAKIRAVQYVDEIDDQKSISPDIINFQKRKEFGWEQEVRIIDYCAHKGGILNDTLEKAPDHVSYPFKPTEVISKIVLLPTLGIVDQISVRCAAKKAGIDAPKMIKL